MRITNREYRHLATVAQDQGWTVTLTHGNHLKWVSPTGSVYFSASSPSDFRALKNLRSDLARRGLRLAPEN